jgi:NitT/TauT family transport system substrate-binding protein
METQTSASLVTVNVCYSGTSGAHLPTWYAYEKGLFKKYGLNVKLTSIDSGTSAMTAMLAGDMDLCQIGASSVVNAVVAKQDAVWIAGFYDTYPAFLMVKPEIKSIYDLKGKAVAISSPGSATDAGTRLMLQKFGLLPDKDVALLAIGDEGARIAAMDAGQVSGTLVVAPFNLVASQKGYVELLDMAKLDIPYQYIGIATSHKFLQADRPIVEEFMKAILEAIQSSKKDPEGAKAVLAKYLALDPTKDAAVLDDTYQTMVVENLKSVPDPSLAGIQSLIDNLKNNNPDATQFTPGQVVDTSVLQDMKTSGFLTNLGK